MLNRVDIINLEGAYGHEVYDRELIAAARVNEASMRDKLPTINNKGKDETKELPGRKDSN